MRHVVGRLLLCLTLLVLVVALLSPRTDSHALAAENARAAPALTSTYAQTILGDSPQAYWRLDEISGTSFADSTGNGNTGVLTSAVTLGAPGAVVTDPADASVLLLPALTYHINVPSAPGINTTGGVTLEGWVNPVLSVGSGPAVVSINATNNIGSYVITVASSGANTGVVTVRAGLTTTQTAIVSSAVGAATIGQWNYIVGTYDGTTLALYLNGALVASQPTSASLGVPIKNAILGGQNLLGDLDEVAVYGHALTASQVQAHYVAALGFLPATNTPTLTGTATPTATPSSTRTVTPTRTPSDTRTMTPTRTPSDTRIATDTRTPTGTRTPTFTLTPTLTPTVPPTLTPSPTTTQTNPQSLTDATGQTETFSTSGTVDHTNPFFQSLGTNGRSCATCHIQSEGWSITPAQVQAIFDATAGLDPLFAVVDGTESPLMDMSTLAARTTATSMLRRRGVFRVDRPIPPGAEFVLDAVVDPYEFATANELSLFRRPLPSANVAFVSGVMWDDRNTVQPLLPGNSASQNLTALQADLNQVSLMATINHEQGPPPTQDQLNQITAFELGLYVAQIQNTNASQLDADGATGGAVTLASTPFFIGINDPFGQNPTGAVFTSTNMTMFAPWSSLTPTPPIGSVSVARDLVVSGENLFNTRTFQISNVRGLNDVLGQPSITGTCSTCHDTPGVGNHSVDLLLATGVDVEQSLVEPLYTLRNIATGQVTQTHDPGLALTTGKWEDVGKFKVPVLRGLAARAPYFHDGSANNLVSVGVFYNQRFQIGLSSKELGELAAFLATL